MLPNIWKSNGSLRAPSMDDFIEKFFYGWPSYEKDSSAAWTPRVDVTENDDGIIIDMELPGIEKNDVKVEVKDNVLVVSGERKNDREYNEKNFHRIERHYGKFERSFGLPETVNPEKVSASYKNGVLTLEMAKTEKAKPREIAVEVK